MLRALLLLVLLLAGVLAGGWLLLPAPAVPPDTPGTGGATTPADPAGGAPRSASSSARDAPHPAAPDRLELDTEPLASRPEAAPERFAGRSLRVVSAADGSPLAGVEVYVVERSTLTDEQRRELSNADLDQVFATVAAAGRRCADTEADGLTLLPSADAERVLGYVVARHVRPEVGRPAIGWKRMQLDAGGPAVLELADRHDLEVLVLGLNGAPADQVPLKLVCPRAGGYRTAWSGSTDAAGRATIPWVRARCIAAHYGDDTAPLRAVLGVDLLLPEPEQSELDLTELPDEPVGFQLPATGSVRVAVESLGNTEATVRLRRDVRPDQDFAVGESVGADTEDGVARFRHIGLGLQLQIAATQPNANQGTVVEAVGPRAPGQQVEVVVRMFQDTPVIRARLVDGDAEPLPAASVRVTAKAAEGNSSMENHLTVVTDTDGVVLFEPSDDFGPAAERSLAFRLADGSGQCRAEVPKPLRAGVNDLGTLTMTAAPTLLGGRIVDAEGAPVEGARIEVEGKHVFDPAAPEAFYWERIEGGATESDADGRFTVRGVTDWQSLRVEVEARGYQPHERLDVPVGVRDLAVTLEQAAGLEGELLLPPLGTPAWIVLRVRSRTPDAATVEQQVPQSGGPFRFPSLVPGTVSLDVELYGRVAPLRTLEDLRIEPGEVLDVGGIDLRDTLRTLSFRVVDTQGTPVRDAVALWVDPPPAGRSRDAWCGVRVEGGTTKLVVTADPVDLFVYADGFRSTFARTVQDGQEITLPPAPTLVLRVPAEVLPPAGTHRLVAQLERKDDPWGTDVRYQTRSEGGSASIGGARPWDDRLRGTVDAQGVVRFELPEPGTYTIRWRVEVTKPGTTASHRIDATQEVVVGDLVGAQPVPAELTRAEIEAAIPGGF